MKIIQYSLTVAILLAALPSFAQERPKSKAHARISKITPGEEATSAGKETSIHVEVTIAKQRVEFWGTVHILANATVDGKPVILDAKASMKRRYDDRKFFFKPDIHFPLVDKLGPILITFVDKQGQLIDTRASGGKFKDNKKLKRISKTGNGGLVSSLR